MPGDPGSPSNLSVKQKHEIAGFYVGIFHLDIEPLRKLIDSNILSSTW